MYHESNYTLILNHNDRLKIFYSYKEDEEMQEVCIQRVIHNGSIVNMEDLNDSYKNEINRSVKIHLLESTPATVH